MAKTTVTQITDDIDGSPNAEEIAFSYAGTDYTIDLSKKNRAVFDKALQPYIAAATKAPRRGGRRRSRALAADRDLAAVRKWARSQGIAVSDRGRVPKVVVEQYDAAN